MRGTLVRPRPAALLLATIFSIGCGHSQDEWDRKVAEGDELRARLEREQRERQRAEADYTDALTEIDALRRELAEHGLNIDTMSANLESQRTALAEYERRTSQLLETTKRLELLRKKLGALSSLGLVVAVREGRMVIELPGDVLFEPGRDRLKDDGKKVLCQVAAALRADDDLRAREFQVAGHTDDRAVTGGGFKDNWALSALRARAVLLVMVAPSSDGCGGLPPSEWSAAGYGSQHPLASNETSEGREMNRRIELVAQPNLVELGLAPNGPSTKPEPARKSDAAPQVPERDTSE